jgi:hypothetical protein
MVLCHTRADAAALRVRTRAEIRVTGWAGLEPPAGPPAPEVASLAAWMRAAPVSFLLAGHLTAYKDAPGTVAAFPAPTVGARLAVAGDCPDARAAAQPAHLAAASGGQVSLQPGRFAPEQAGHLYAAAHVAVCPDRTDGSLRFFADVLHRVACARTQHRAPSPAAQPPWTSPPRPQFQAARGHRMVRPVSGRCRRANLGQLARGPRPSAGIRRAAIAPPGPGPAGGSPGRRRSQGSAPGAGR